jgi:hypothetical protein
MLLRLEKKKVRMILLARKLSLQRKGAQDLVALDRNGWYVRMLMHHPMLFRSFWSFVKEVCTYGSWTKCPNLYIYIDRINLKDNYIWVDESLILLFNR